MSITSGVLKLALVLIATALALHHPLAGAVTQPEPTAPGTHPKDTDNPPAEPLADPSADAAAAPAKPAAPAGDDKKGSDAAKAPAGKNPPVAGKKNTSGPVSVAANDLKDIKCGTCFGLGTVEKRVKVGTRSTNTWPQVTIPVHENQIDRCKTCDGVRLKKAERLNVLFGNLCKALDVFDPAEAKADEALERTRVALAASTNFGLSGLQSRLNPSARTRLSNNKPPLGAPIAVVALMVSDEAAGPDRPRVIIATLGNDMRIRVEDPRIVDGIKDETVLVGGILERRDINGGEYQVVLRGGFVMTDRN